MGGFAYGNFSGDTNGFGAKTLGLYPDGNTFAASGSVIGEYNFAPNVAFSLAPEYSCTGFGSTIQNSRRLHRRHRLPLRQAVKPHQPASNPTALHRPWGLSFQGLHPQSLSP